MQQARCVAIARQRGRSTAASPAPQPGFHTLQRGQPAHGRPRVLQQIALRVALVLVHVDEQQRLAQCAPGQQFELVETCALLGTAALEHLQPELDGIAQLPQRALVSAKFVQRMPGRAQASQEQLVFPGAPREGRRAAGDLGSVRAGATRAHGFVNVGRQRTQAVAQLPRLLVGHPLAQEAADVAKRLERQQLAGAGGGHDAIVRSWSVEPKLR